MAAFVLLAVRRFNTEAHSLYERILDALDEALRCRPFSAAVSLDRVRDGAGLAEIASQSREPDAAPVHRETFSDRQRFPRVTAVARTTCGNQQSRRGLRFGLDLYLR
jgi:hypothetical protein